MFRTRGLVGLVVLLFAAAACTDSGGDDAGGGDANEVESPVSTVDRPDGPAAELEELSGGNGIFLGSPDAFDAEGNYAVELDEPGYVQEELVASGSATSFLVDGELTPDGEWTLQPGETADYRTRVLVRRPENPEDFSGVVVVEWFNVSGGIDADPGWSTLHEEILRQGHAYVGVTAQALGIEGGTPRVTVDHPGARYQGMGLPQIDPERYGSLEHPGDAYSYDIYTQVARALLAGQGLGELEVQRLIASGQSQSAAALVSYVNGVQPTTRAFDGFFIHSRGSSSLPFPPVGESVDIASTIGRPKTILRTDTTVPIINVQAENDVVGLLNAIDSRQPDSDTFRLWEVAGTAHADRTLTGDMTADLNACGLPTNQGPMHLVAKAAFRHLVAWTLDGDPPPEAPRIEVTDGDETKIVRDADGIAVGGVRTPPVDVPVQVLSGVAGPVGDAPICVLAGSTAPLPPDRIAELYPSVEDYQSAYDDAVDHAIDMGMVLEDDRAAIESYAKPELVG